MKKLSIVMMSMAVAAVFGIGAAAAQSSAPTAPGLGFGTPTEPTKLTCEPIGTGVWDCTQTFCEKVGTNQSNQCKTYRFIVNDGKGE